MSSVGDMIVNVSLVPVSEIISEMIEEISATITAAKDVLIEQQNFAEVSSYLERLVPVLKELTKKNIHNYDSVNKAIDILRREIKDARQLTLECCRRKRVYLLVNCRRIVKSLQDTTREISRALSLIPLASLDLSSSVNNEINKLSDTMLKAEFRAAVMEENIIEKIESGIQERNADRSYANNLLVLIAKAVGISAEQSELKKLLDELKSEIEDAKVKKDQAEAIQMDQIIALLGSADAALSQREREVKYYTKRNSLGNQPLEPLKSFSCPITGEVMVDPVETSSGQTFERDAIKKWLTDGHTTCPLTMIPLNRDILRPNITLRKSIEEWKDRNTMITIASMRSKLSSGEEQEILDCLDQLKGLCEERESHREWVVLDNYIEYLANFLGRKNPQIRTRVLVILCLLAKDSDDNKEKIARLDSSIESIVKSLAKSIVEAKLALALLLELSKHDMVRNRIGQIKGCILLLVTLLNNDDTQATTDAMKLLKNLSILDQNVVQMAKANYFEPLLERLSSGSDNMKRIMAAALAEIELTDIGKSTLVEQGVLGSLLSLISDGDTEARLSAVKALYNLSTLHCNGLRMTREGAIGSLLHLLYFHGASPSPTLRELVAATIMNISMSATTRESCDLFIQVLDSDIMKLLSLVNMTGPGVQRSILRTFHALCKHPSAIEMRTKLRQCSLVPLLIQLFEQYEQVDQTIRADALKLFYCLIKDDDGGLLQEHVGQKFLERLLRIMEVSEDEEEKTAAMGIISNIPRDLSHITRWLLDAGALQIVVKYLTYAQQNGASKSQLIENSVGVLCRFTVSTNEEWQSKAAEAGIIPLLVQLLESGSPLTKKHAASSLAQFSRNSLRLSRKVEKKRVLWCFSASSEGICPVHMGLCSVELSFCIVEADAVQPLVRVLGDPDIGACESALVALSTLIEDERLQSGSKLISEAYGISAIIRLLSSSSTELLEKALSVLERIFRLQEYKSKYGASARMPLVELTQRGTVSIKPLAAKILQHLNLLPDQSSYFS
ncbi:U-box domain-containing protein 44-like [Aristolochia californica]|uniref:U-box domain-containing protein 44-like n=1 Tax=Aristolochia californica TaxID=171875 RepID=UPI0035D7A07F